MDYRLYFLDEGQHIRGVVQFQCDDDEAALERAKRHMDGRDAELWNLDRLVRKLPRRE